MRTSLKIGIGLVVGFMPSLVVTPAAWAQG